MIHLYEGDGKGKTTAAVGLAVRMAGAGKKVLFGQFLKNGTSSELRALEILPQITLKLPEQHFGFTFRMDEKTKRRAKECYTSYFEQLSALADTGGYALLVLDEVLDACRTGLLEEETLASFLRRNGERMEVVLTGREPGDVIQEQADYHTYMKKEKHPYDSGVPARDGVER